MAARTGLYKEASRNETGCMKVGTTIGECVQSRRYRCEYGFTLKAKV